MMGKFEEGRKMVQQMHGLGTAKAPDTLLPGVLTKLGLGDSYWTAETPVGTVYIAQNANGISAVMRARDAEDFEQAFRQIYGRAVYHLSQPPTALHNAILKQLKGEKVPNLRYDLSNLSEFERAVLLKAREIPAGEVRPYSWIAKEIGREKAVRAVGSALGHNPVPLLIPCHRVIKSDGTLGQYSLGGIANKITLLEAEGVPLEELQNLAKAGIRYIGSDTTHIFCNPTCRHAKRITPQHRVKFSNTAVATQSGYVPCKVCRPA
jgi:O-6-methylguanine DNA methyltransferase